MIQSRQFTDRDVGKPLEEGIILHRDEDGVVWTNVPHLVVHHSPTGYEFGYGGSGPADLALNAVEAILERLGHRDDEQVECFDGECSKLAWDVHQGFKRVFIESAPHRGTVIPYKAAEGWVKEQLRKAGEHELKLARILDEFVDDLNEGRVPRIYGLIETDPEAVEELIPLIDLVRWFKSATTRATDEEKERIRARVFAALEEKGLIGEA